MSTSRRPHVLPEGCEKAAEVFADTALGLYYVKWRGSREWQVCQRRPDGLSGTLGWLTAGGRTLMKAREQAAHIIGQSLQRHVQAMHPLAGYMHLREAHYGVPHLCGAPNVFASGSISEVTCPVCRALALNRLTAGAFGVQAQHE